MSFVNKRKLNSLLSSVTTEESPSFEGLQNYRVSEGGRPAAVRSLEGNGVRQPVSLPTGVLPGAQNPIPTSSARPGKATNQRIVYPRVQTNFSEDYGGALRASSVCEGDVVFVHRRDGCTTSGHGANRTSRVATLRQLNAALDPLLNGTEKIGTIAMPSEIERADHDPQLLGPAGLDADKYRREQIEDYRSRGIEENVNQMVTIDWDGEDQRSYRWKHCSFLADWVPDGVLASREHDVVEGESNPGEVYNVAVGGPTLMRNSAVGEFAQHFDDAVGVLDKVFVGLIADEKRADDKSWWQYQYKLFTSRQLVRTRILARNGQDDALGPTASEFRRMVQVWRLGSVLDTKTGSLPYKCVTLNVVVEEWTIEHLSRAFNDELALPAKMLGAGDIKCYDFKELKEQAERNYYYHSKMVDAAHRIFSKIPPIQPEVIDRIWRVLDQWQRVAGCLYSYQDYGIPHPNPKKASEDYEDDTEERESNREPQLYYYAPLEPEMTLLKKAAEKLSSSDDVGGTDIGALAHDIMFRISARAVDASGRRSEQWPAFAKIHDMYVKFVQVHEMCKIAFRLDREWPEFAK